MLKLTKKKNEMSNRTVMKCCMLTRDQAERDIQREREKERERESRTEAGWHN